MRRKTAKTLADLGRLVPMAVCLFAGSVAWIWTHHAGAVAGFETRLVHALTGRLQGQFAAAGQAADAARERELLEGLVHDLEHVRSGDRLAEMVDDCHARLIELAKARGDLDEALTWARASVAFDDRNVRTLVRLGELLCARPETRGEGLANLSALARKFGGNPHVACALATGLAAAGRGVDALDALDAADAVPQSNRWIVLWDEGQGYAGCSAHQIPVIEHGRFRLRFDIAGRCRRVRFLVPLFASFALEQPALHVVAGGQTQVLSLLGPGATVQRMVRVGTRLEATGTSDAFLEVQLPDVAADRWEFTFVAGWQRRRSTLLAAATVLPAMNAIREQWLRQGDTAALARLQGWRAVAYAGLEMELFHRRGDESYARTRKVPGSIEALPNGNIAVAFAVGAAASELRIDLPGQPAFLTFRFTSMQVVVDGRATDLDPRTMPLNGTHDVERREGTFVATGGDPYFWFAVPAGSRVDAVRLEGVP